MQTTDLKKIFERVPSWPRVLAAALARGVFFVVEMIDLRVTGFDFPQLTAPILPVHLLHVPHVAKLRVEPPAPPKNTSNLRAGIVL
jgi:hypothetical protein